MLPHSAQGGVLAGTAPGRRLVDGPCLTVLRRLCVQLD